MSPISKRARSSENSKLYRKEKHDDDQQDPFFYTNQSKENCDLNKSR